MKKTSITEIILWTVSGVSFVICAITGFYLKSKDTHSVWWNHRHISPQTFNEYPQVSTWFFISLPICILCYFLIKLVEDK